MSANYWASTQCNNWLLDRPQLQLARKQDLKYASSLECAALGVFFSNPKRLNLRQRVVASANIFFRRFFAKNSYSALDPFLVAATCVYVAAKVEESPIHIKSAVAEASRSFQEVGFRSMPTDNSSLAEMEFYLLEEMEFDMIIFHPYRSLIALYDLYGNGKDDGIQGGGGGATAAAAAAAASGGVVTGLGLESEAFGVIKGLTSVEERDSGVGHGKAVKLLEFDEQVLQMSWFVLNDTYKTDIPLMYAPYMVALASLWLALTLHTPSYDRINHSLATMQQKRLQHSLAIESVLNNPQANVDELPNEQDLMPPSEEALTFFASLNISLPLLAEVVQEIVMGYKVQNETRGLVADGMRMCKLLDRMREARRQELIAKATESHDSAGMATHR
ncbi:related to SSN8 - DNA-directed RNA polymerase II holoenzyme and SRB subcomplex subunit, cyclin C homolog [Melanopsichium pennsylvanicum]|uniref:Related to SSN8 - DNA-directed RNA polymerase II holoenzyme and SRB subcomplex subunit, cyclin C homolog n=1 Tax=Melanopsichium pennsylvanicum TaxID=63383 RepID=A0AAJ4XSX3_9BASI|nr:related to SSN8 - DNA-directed RNA polymerase II holoenzyme and SRB subcomplex subunit, cyclin C homolog [Melanopsichium pennsylvanicum]